MLIWHWINNLMANVCFVRIMCLLLQERLMATLKYQPHKFLGVKMFNPTLVISAFGITHSIANAFAITAQFILKHSRLTISNFNHSRSRISYFTYTSGQIFKTFYL